MYHQSIKNIIEYIIINFNNSSKKIIQDYIYDLLYNNVYSVNIENINTIKKIINHKFNKNIKNEEIIDILNNFKKNIL